ncbi:hypothetical protein A2108_02490 [Candidatus Wolfebacteria bacterium GWA1_42_9]|uniref:Uncharacterized protein n=1 Tax=Candidatus Wolfebacteria bacterium GWA1_42_9 TaxID=1802553 RepID=A0A1F8DMJ5_9BACT|nr:MAG: hypothetical protein A2108_02490 [Candidatus Wolfebacteria bacterium GWA1_42_9]
MQTALQPRPSVPVSANDLRQDTETAVATKTAGALVQSPSGCAFYILEKPSAKVYINNVFGPVV